MRSHWLDRERKFKTLSRTAPVIAACLGLSACGDDLDSRQAAVDERQPPRDAITIERAEPRRATSATPDQGNTISEMDDEVIVDAGPEIFVDDAQGFSPDPMDDTTGFDPTPIDPGGFAPEPLAPESFED